MHSWSSDVSQGENLSDMKIPCTYPNFDSNKSDIQQEGAHRAATGIEGRAHTTYAM